MISRTETPADSTDSENVDDIESHLRLTVDFRRNIAANSKRLREQLGLRQLDLANLMETSQGQVAALEKTKLNIGLLTLTRLGHALQVEPSTLLHHYKGDQESDLPTESNPPFESTSSDESIPVATSIEPPARVPHPMENLAVGVSLTKVKVIVGATFKKLEALERRHGSVPMTREMLTSVLVTLLSASQNMDDIET